MQRISIICLVVVTAALSLLGSTAVQPAFAGEERIEVIATDSSYEKSVSPGDTQNFTWTVANINNRNVSYRIEASVQNPSNWQVDISPQIVPALAPGEVSGFVLNVTPPADAAEDSLNISVTFLARQNGTTVSRAVRYAITHLVLPPAPPSEKLVLDIFRNPLPPPLDNDYGVFLLTLAIWVIIAIAITLALDPFVKTFTRKTKTKVDDIILDTVRAPLLVLLVLFATKQSLGVLDVVIPQWVLDIVYQVYNVAFVLILFYIAYKLFKNLLVHYAKEIASRTETKLDDIMVPVVEKLGVVALGVVALGYALNYLNIDLTMFVAGGVVISMVIAFAAQETLSNFFSGIFILLERPFKEGDTIIMPGNEWCEIRNIGLRKTQLFRYKDATLIHMPNNKIANEYIANFSSPADMGRHMMTIGVGYDSDPDQVKDILKGIIADCPHIVKDNEKFTPVVRFDAFSDSSIDFFILVWLTDRSKRFEVRDFLNCEILKRFRKAGIEIPFPQRVVHLQDEKKEGELS